MACEWAFLFGCGLWSSGLLDEALDLQAQTLGPSVHPLPQVQSIEFAQIEMKVLQGLQFGNECLKKMHQVRPRGPGGHGDGCAWDTGPWQEGTPETAQLFWGSYSPGLPLVPRLPQTLSPALVGLGQSRQELPKQWGAPKQKPHGQEPWSWQRAGLSRARLFLAASAPDQTPPQVMSMEEVERILDETQEAVEYQRVREAGLTVGLTAGGVPLPGQGALVFLLPPALTAPPPCAANR